MPRSDLLAAVVFFQERRPPYVVLIPSLAWSSPRGPLKSRDYVGKKSKPEWGFQVSKSHLAQLSEFEFDKAIESL